MSVATSDVIPRPETKKILDIQALRGFAVLIVIFEHLSLSATLWASIGWKRHPAGWSGVELFFIISGFVVTLSFVKKQFRVGPFFAKRIARLYPAMLVVIGLVLGANLWFALGGFESSGAAMFLQPWGKLFLDSLSVLFGYSILVGGPHAYAYGAMWSLAVEDQFYVAMGLLCLLLRLCRVPVPRILAALMVVCALTAGIVWLGRGMVLAGSKTTDSLPVLRYLVNWNFDFLMIGVIVYCVRDRAVRWAKADALTGALFVLALLGPVFLVPFLGNPLDRETRPLLAGIGMPLMAVSFAFVVLLASRNLSPIARVPVLNQFLIWWGERSYTAYLLHFPLFQVAWAIMAKTAPQWFFSSAWIYAAAQLLLVTVLGVPVVELIYRVVERPVLKWAGSKLGEREHGTSSRTENVREMARGEVLRDVKLPSSPREIGQLQS
ncbi:MAG: acyltransferase [Phycisphaeraceae bacterium]|nr:acyltransferase [Phycisphaeraceae bacterium]